MRAPSWRHANAVTWRQSNYTGVHFFLLNWDLFIHARTKTLGGARKFLWTYKHCSRWRIWKIIGRFLVCLVLPRAPHLIQHMFFGKISSHCSAINMDAISNIDFLGYILGRKAVTEWKKSIVREAATSCVKLLETIIKGLLFLYKIHHRLIVSMGKINWGFWNFPLSNMVRINSSYMFKYPHLHFLLNDTWSWAIGPVTTMT